MAERDQEQSPRRGLLSVAEKAGRGGDRVLGHLTPGELVVPVSCQTPELMEMFAQAAHRHGLDPNRFIVGSEAASRNPKTGLEEFLEGESGGVGDTGSDPNGGGGYGPGGATGASGKGGENAAHGETGNQSSGYGPAGPDHGFGGYDGPLSQAGNHDQAVDDDGILGQIGNVIGARFSQLGPTKDSLGTIGRTTIGFAAPVVGAAMTVSDIMRSLTGEEGVVTRDDMSPRGGDQRVEAPEARRRRGLLRRSA